MKQVGSIETVPKLREIVDAYDLTSNPNKNGQLFWEFEPGRIFPYQPAIDSMHHAFIHLGNLRERVLSERWDTGAETIPELFCIARRIERACGRRAASELIEEALGEYALTSSSDLVVATVIAETTLREKVLHDTMHAQVETPRPKISRDVADYAVDTAVELWAIGLLACELMNSYNPEQALADRLNALAHRFSGGLLSNVVILQA